MGGGDRDIGVPQGPGSGVDAVSAANQGTIFFTQDVDRSQRFYAMIAQPRAQAPEDFLSAIVEIVPALFRGEFSDSGGRRLNDKGTLWSIATKGSEDRRRSRFEVDLADGIPGFGREMFSRLDV
jgi:hypothetical protein